MGMTPSDSPSSPGNYADVAASGFDIQAPLDLGAVQAAFDATNAEMGAGVLYPQSPRQAETRQLLESPPGYADFDILSGTTAGWPADVTP